MTHPNKTRGDKAEREAAALLTNLLGVTVRRKLGAGRTDAAGGDTGDLEGVPEHAIQVANWGDLARALRVKPAAAAEQAERAGMRHGVALIRLRGGDFRVCMTPLEWTRYLCRIGTAEAELAGLEAAIRRVNAGSLLPCDFPPGCAP